MQKSKLADVSSGAISSKRTLKSKNLNQKAKNRKPILSKAGKNNQVNYTIDIEHQISKRNLQFEKLKNSSSSNLASASNLKQKCKIQSKLEKLKDTNIVLRNKNIKLQDQNNKLNKENIALLNEIKHLRAAAYRNSNKSKQRTTSQNNRNSANNDRHRSVSNNARANRKEKKYFSTCKNFNKNAEFIATRKDFEHVLKNLKNFHNSVKIPKEVLGQNEALYIENGVLRQAIQLYESYVSPEANEFIHEK